MKKRTLWVSLGLAVASYVLCIIAQGFPNLAQGNTFPLIPNTLDSIVECIGFVAGIVGLYLMIVESWVNFPVGLCWAVAYAVLFFGPDVHHLGEGSIMVITCGYLLHGWWCWTRGLKTDDIPVRRFNKTDLLVTSITVVAGWPIVFYAVNALQGKFPLLDSLTTVLSLAAQYLTNKKVFENWYVWIAADCVYVPLFVYRGYYSTAILYGIFLVMGFWGIRDWKRTMSQQNKEVAQPTG